MEAEKRHVDFTQGVIWKRLLLFSGGGQPRPNGRPARDEIVRAPFSRPSKYAGRALNAA